MSSSAHESHVKLIAELRTMRDAVAAAARKLISASRGWNPPVPEME